MQCIFPPLWNAYCLVTPNFLYIVITKQKRQQSPAPVDPQSGRFWDMEPDSSFIIKMLKKSALHLGHFCSDSLVLYCVIMGTLLGLSVASQAWLYVSVCVCKSVLCATNGGPESAIPFSSNAQYVVWAVMKSSSLRPQCVKGSWDVHDKGCAEKMLAKQPAPVQWSICVSKGSRSSRSLKG